MESVGKWSDAGASETRPDTQSGVVAEVRAVLCSASYRGRC